MDEALRHARTIAGEDAWLAGGARLMPVMPLKPSPPAFGGAQTAGSASVGCAPNAAEAAAGGVRGATGTAAVVVNGGDSFT